jgi:glycosyltransferase involved in cell wall biosynthesis
MKILFLSHGFYPHIGGVEVNSEILAGCFFGAGHDVRLVTWTEEGGDKSFPYEVIRNPGKLELFRHHFWADLVFENNPVLKLAWPAFFLGKICVVALRTWMERDGGSLGWQDKLKIKWLSRARGVVAVSKVLRDAYWKQAVVIGNPYRNHLFRRLEGVMPTQDFVFLGRLVNDKGADMAIEAIARLSSPFTLSIIGDGPEMEALKKLVEKHDLTAQVRFCGSLSGELLVLELAGHKYMLVPSQLKEPFGNVALEGMACGCIPIVSDGGGLPDAVGDAGLVFKRSSIDGLVETLQGLLNDPELEDRLRRNAPGHLEQHLPEVVGRKYLRVIENAFNGTGI